jgi:hypothetical protein
LVFNMFDIEERFEETNIGLDKVSDSGDFMWAKAANSFYNAETGSIIRLSGLAGATKTDDMVDPQEANRLHPNAKVPYVDWTSKSRIEKIKEYEKEDAERDYIIQNGDDSLVPQLVGHATTFAVQIFDPVALAADAALGAGFLYGGAKGLWKTSRALRASAKLAGQAGKRFAVREFAETVGVGLLANVGGEAALVHQAREQMQDDVDLSESIVNVAAASIALPFIFKGLGKLKDMSFKQIHKLSNIMHGKIDAGFKTDITANDELLAGVLNSQGRIDGDTTVMDFAGNAEGARILDNIFTQMQSELGELKARQIIEAAAEVDGLTLRELHKIYLDAAGKGDPRGLNEFYGIRDAKPKELSEAEMRDFRREANLPENKVGYDEAAQKEVDDINNFKEEQTIEDMKTHRKSLENDPTLSEAARESIKKVDAETKDELLKEDLVLATEKCVRGV